MNPEVESDPSFQTDATYKVSELDSIHSTKRRQFDDVKSSLARFDLGNERRVRTEASGHVGLRQSGVAASLAKPVEHRLILFGES